MTKYRVNYSMYIVVKNTSKDIHIASIVRECNPVFLNRSKFSKRVDLEKNNSRRQKACKINQLAKR